MGGGDCERLLVMWIDSSKLVGVIDMSLMIGFGAGRFWRDGCEEWTRLCVQSG
jgi:hypothetical protein